MGRFWRLVFCFALRFSGVGSPLSPRKICTVTAGRKRNTTGARGGALVVDFRVIKKPTDIVNLRMDCKYPCSGSVRFTKVLLDTPLGEWKQKSVPTTCFANEGLQLAQVNTTFVLATEGDITLDISEIKLTTMPAIRSIVSCADLVNDTELLN